MKGRRFREPAPPFSAQARVLFSRIAVIHPRGGTDTLMATIVARHIYNPADLRFGRRFADIFDRREDGSFAIDYTRFHETID